MQRPDRNTFERLVKLIRQDADVCEWFRSVLRAETGKLVYSSGDADFKVAQGRVQIMTEIMQLIDDAKSVL